MKASIFISLFVLGANVLLAQESDALLMTVGDGQVMKSEFERIYRKNNPKGSDNETSIDEYLNLFINFKLKVTEAMAEGMDTATNFQDELRGYREQLAKPYLTDNEVTEKLIKEAYERSKWDLSVSHLLIKTDRYPKPQDTLIAYNKALSLYKQINGKHEAFDRVAQTAVNADTSGNTIKEDITFSALTLVYNFENAAYNAEVGTVTKPVRTRFGYHLIYVKDKRPAMGQVRVAHILVGVPKDASAEVIKGAKEKADVIYEAITKEEKDFGQMAKLHSSDGGSAQKGGVLPWFGTGRMVPEFEQGVVGLKNVGDVSEPVRTSYGWHIIKLLERKEMPDFEKVKPELKERIARDERSKISTSARIQEIKKEYAFEEYPKAYEPVKKLGDESIFTRKWSAEKAAKLKKPLFKLGDSTYTQMDFAAYVEHNQKPAPKNISVEKFMDMLYKDYVDETCLAYENERLEKKYPEFRDLVTEYHDGILLFEMMDKMVWSRAVKDSAGLESFYEKNKTNFMWQERMEASAYECENADVAKLLRATLKKNPSSAPATILEKVNGAGKGSVSLKDDGLFQKAEKPWMEKVKWAEGVSENIPSGEKILVVSVRKIHPPVPKSLKEAKGLVTAAYQDYLEKEWINALKEKYPVNVNREVLKTIQ
ncbi:MAG: peptidylprolyl isomerase [Flavobacteriales bacterium]|nr:peptidylprolyl isomerase [Flavobacteriales bacterium]